MEMNVSKRDGMIVLPMEEAERRLRECEDITGCYLLYPDNTEALIEEGYDREQIKDSLKKGCLIGEELKPARLLDGTEVLVPPAIDITELGYFDEMENKLWELVKEYFDLMGIRVKNDDDVDFGTVKAMQDTLLDELEKAGVNFIVDKAYPVPVREGQRRQFNESGNIFTVGKKVYEDRDFYECIYENGEKRNHDRIIILCRSNVID